MRRDSTVLDTLRAVAVLLVLGAHLSELFASQGAASLAPWHWHIGRLGVLLFFVHTMLHERASSPTAWPGAGADLPFWAFGLAKGPGV